MNSYDEIITAIELAFPEFDWLVRTDQAKGLFFAHVHNEGYVKSFTSWADSGEIALLEAYSAALNSMGVVQ